VFRFKVVGLGFLGLHTNPSMQLCLFCLSHDMSTSINHVPQKA